MIEKIVLDYLNKTLKVPVYMEMPEMGQTERFVLIEKTGSRSENLINFATFAIQSYANSLYEAAKLNEVVKEAMNNIVSLDVVFGSELNTDYNFTDTTKKRYRYQAVYDLSY